MEITREGTAPAGSANTVSIDSLYVHSETGVYTPMAREGSTFPFVLTRTGDTSESLTVAVDVYESDTPAGIASGPEETVTVEFEAGQASARLDVETTSDSIATGSYYLYGQLVPASGYQVDDSGRSARWFVWEDDYGKLNLAEISVTDSSGAVLDIGTFDPTETSYVGSVGSTVEYVTIAATESIHSIRSTILPGDSNPDIAGHQVDLSYGTNQIIVVVTRWEDGVNTYGLEINRAGSADLGSAVTVSVWGTDRYTWEGDPIPLLLTRTGDTSEALTAQVAVTESGGDMVSVDSKGELDVEFEAGHASARLDVSTNADDAWEEHSTVEVTVKESSSYQVSSDSGAASILVIDNDVPRVTATLTVDSTEVEEGDETTATITVVTDGPREPHAFMGNLLIQAEAGTAEEKDFQLQGVNGARMSVGQAGFDPVESGGVITSYQRQYSAKILMTDDDRPEADESFRVYLKISKNGNDALTLDEDSDSHIITIPGGEETPASADSFGYATVVVADSGTSGSTFTVTWTDAETCSTYYRAQLTYARKTAVQDHGSVRYRSSGLGSTENGGTQITGSLNNTDGIGTDFVVGLYCAQMGLVSEVPIPTEATWNGEKPKPGTYSSEPPLSGLAVSSGTLSPAFSKFGSLYAILDLPDDKRQITLSPTVKSGYSVTWDPATDADPTVPGHQVDLDAGYNTISLAVDPDQGGMSFTYDIIVKRSETGVEANSPATGTPTISGTTQVGQTLTADTTGIADTDGLTNVSYDYQWLADDAEIASATGNTYVLTSAELGKAVRVRVSFTDDAGNEESLTSAATDAVAAVPPPPPDNVRAVTQESGAVELTWEAPQDATVTGYRIERSRDDENRGGQQRSDGRPRDNHTLVEDTGSADTGYTDKSAEKGVEYEYRVSARNEAGAGESSDWVRAGPESASNSPATGAPVIIGTAQVGETLTADTSGIADMDGLTNGLYGYQWVKNDGTTDSDITGAMRSTYRLGADDQGKAIKLRVRFSDDAGNWETLTSSATAAVPIEATFTFKIDGTTVTCDSYDVHIGPKEECDDPTSIDQGENTDIEVGIEIDRSVSRQSHRFRFGIYQVEDTLGRLQGHEANDFCLGPGLAESVSIEVAPADGTGPFTYTDEGTIFELCPAGTYELAVFWYRYNYTDQEYEYAGTFRRFFFINGNDEVDTSIERVKFITALYPDPPVSHDDVQIEATKESTVLNRELATFSLSIGGLVPDSDPDTTDYVVRLRVIGNDSEGTRRAVAWCHVGNVGYSYLLKTVPEDGRLAMDAHVLGSCLWHWWPDTLQIELFNGSYEFIAGKEIALGELPNSPATGAPTINGAAEIGETLTVSTSGIQDANGLSGATFSYQWLGSRDTEIQGATNATYTLVAADEGKAIKVRVSFTDDRGNAESLTSAPTSAVEANANNPATGLPTISGTAQVGETLTADTTGIADADGLSGETFTYQWVSGDGTTDTDIENATGATYKLVDADQGRSVKVRVTFTDDGGNEETLTSAPTAPVWGDGLPGAPRNLTATPGNKEVTLSWDPPADNGNAPATRYRIEWRVDGKDYDKNHWGTARSTTYTTNDQANLANGVRYFFRVKAENDDGNSYGPYGPASEEVSATPTSGSAVDLGTPVLSDTETLHHGMVRLDWQDIEDAGWYVVQYYHLEGGEWLDLPAEGVDIAFHGSSAVVSNLHGLSWLRVRCGELCGRIGVVANRAVVRDQ